MGSESIFRPRSRALPRKIDSDPIFQRGLSLFGALVIVALAVVALYYVYKGVTGEDEAPSCRSAHTDCLKNCRRTRTEAPELQRCLEACQRDVDACERRGQ